MTLRCGFVKQVQAATLSAAFDVPPVFCSVSVQAEGRYHDNEPSTLHCPGLSAPGGDRAVQYDATARRWFQQTADCTSVKRHWPDIQVEFVRLWRLVAFAKVICCVLCLLLNVFHPKGRLKSSDYLKTSFGASSTISLSMGNDIFY